MGHPIFCCRYRQQLSMEPFGPYFVIPSEAEGSAVLRTFPGKTDLPLKMNCHLDRSEAKWRDLRFLSTIAALLLPDSDPGARQVPVAHADQIQQTV